jgi:hypothetical protein
MLTPESLEAMSRTGRSRRPLKLSKASHHRVGAASAGAKCAHVVRARGGALPTSVQGRAGGSRRPLVISGSFTVPRHHGHTELITLA